MDADERVLELVGGELLRDETGGPHGEGLFHALGLGRPGVDDDASDLGQLHERAQFLGVVLVGEGVVEGDLDGAVRQPAGLELEHAEALVPLEELVEPLYDDVVVVDQGNGDRVPGLHGDDASGQAVGMGRPGWVTPPPRGPTVVRGGGGDAPDAFASSDHDPIVVGLDTGNRGNAKGKGKN